MKKWVLFLFTLCPFWMAAQGDVNIDSILIVIEKTTPSVEKIEAHFEAYHYYVNKQDEVNGFKHLDLADQMAEQLSLSHELAKSYYFRGRLFTYTDDPIQGSVWYNKALRLSDGLTPHEKIVAFNSDAVNYLTFSEFQKAAIIFTKAIKEIPEATKETEKTYAYLYNNLGYAYSNMDNLDSSMHFHLICKELRETAKDTFGLGQTYYNLGSLHYEYEDYDSALVIYQMSLDFRRSFSKTPQSAIIESNIGIGKALLALRRYGQAEKLLVKMEKETMTNAVFGELRHRISKELMRLYKETKQYKKAFDYAEFYYIMKDSLFDIEKREQIIQLNSKNQYEDKVLQDSLQYAEKERIAQLEKDKEAEVQEHRDAANRVFKIGLILTIILMGGIIVLIYRNYKSKKIASEQILQQKIEVEKQRDIAHFQKEKLALVHQEITDSITYAKRIQSSIMPSEESVSRMLKEYFIYYQPKAIVAGDFYWFLKMKDRVYFSAADCTGHGVPGALVSVVCSNALNRAVEEYELKKPGEILDRARELVIDAFSKNEQLVKDGMDLSICCLNTKTNTLEYAGANNPLYIVRSIDGKRLDEKVVKDDTHYIHEIKPDKQAVGYAENKKPFTTHKIKLEVGDVIYSFTDGYPDQFGGDNLAISKPGGKKFKYSSLKKLLLQISSNDMKEQGDLLAENFENWKGDLEQLDDVCVIGVRVSLASRQV